MYIYVFKLTYCILYALFYNVLLYNMYIYLYIVFKL